MKNISFADPILLLLIIPLLLCIVIPIIIAIRRENKSKSVFISMALHIIISLCVTLAVAGLIHTTVMTKTEVWVVADVSYSANRNLNELDGYIAEIRENLPKNATLGVVVFAKDAKVLVEQGGEAVSVKDNHGFKHDTVSGTDIAGALEYTAGLFSEDVIKRMVLITDGKETKLGTAGELIGAIETVYAADIYLDALYLDDNLAEGVGEVQISDVQFSSTAYKNHESKATLLIESNIDTENVILDFLVDSIEESRTVLSLSKGYNIIHFDLPTSAAGPYDYTFAIRTDAPEDSTFNNTYSFTQTVVERQRVLLVSWDEADLARVEALYGHTADIDAFIKDPNVPCGIDELCRYDEIILSDFDIRDLNNVTAFIDGIDTAVSRFGKSLITMGDLRIQNKTDDVLRQLEDMLPVRFGNNDQDPKLYAIVFDASRSMQNFSSLVIAKQAAIQLINMLDDKDSVTIVTFWGEISTPLPPTPIEGRREEIIDLISNIKPYQGTVIGTALEEAGDQLIEYAQNFSERQIMLISDGMSYTLESDTPADVVSKLRDHGIITSVIHPTGKEEGRPTLTAIAEAGGGAYFPIVRESELMDIMFSEVADDLTDSVIHGRTPVNLRREGDSVLSGITDFPDVMGYTYAKAKSAATTVLTVDFVKSGGNTVKAPLYAYWNYGNGRVASYTSTLSGAWAETMTNGAGELFFRNLLATNTPAEHVDYPFTVDITYDSFEAKLELTPVVLDPSAVVTLTLTLPGEMVQEPITLPFDAAGYTYRFPLPATGKYVLNINYSYDFTTPEVDDMYDDTDPDTLIPVAGKSFDAAVTFTVPYSPEYNSFEVFDPATLHAAIRNRGTVWEGSIPTLENNDKEIATYTVRYTVPLMIIAVVLYVIDIMIRKLKLHDLKTFFGIKQRKGGR